MGLRLSSYSNESLKRSNVKLQAQNVSDFNGSALKWHTWKKKTRAAIGTAGMLRVIDSREYLKKNPVDNETVFHLLQVATSDGNAAHLVDKFEEERDGFAAFEELTQWYEGDQLTTETAKDVRAKLDRTKLSTKNTASDYIDDFLQYTKQLEELEESYTSSKTVNIFLTQIHDPDYAVTAEMCVENRIQLNDCIERIRSKERRLRREKRSTRTGDLIVRRNYTSEQQQNSEDPETITLENHKTSLGYYSIPNHLWQKLSENDKEKVRKHNGARRRQRRNEYGESGKKTGDPRNISQRRALMQEEEKKEDKEAESPKKKAKTVQFHDNHPNEDVEVTDNKEPRMITGRRDVLRFQVKKKE